MSRILVIDDSDLIGKLLNEALTASGYEVAVAIDANEGYEAAIEFQPDLILLDVQLPDVSGHDLISIFKNREDLKDVPIIMITGTHHKTEHKVKAFKAGADDYILKPFEMPELIERVAAVLRRSGRNGSPRGPELVRVIPAAEPMPDRPVPNPIPSTPMGNLSAAPKDALPPVAPAPAMRQKPLGLPNAIQALLLQPEKFPFQAPLPPTSMAFLLSTLALGFSGLALSAGPAIKPAVFTLVLTLSWVVLVSVLVMSSSVIGLTLSWKEGGRLFSLAMMPLILKLAGGVLSSVWTSLSPFYFTAGPAIFVKTPSLWLERVDCFELWSVGLLWWLLRHRPASTPKRASIISGLIWLTAAAIIAAVRQLGS